MFPGEVGLESSDPREHVHRGSRSFKFYECPTHRRLRNQHGFGAALRVGSEPHTTCEHDATLSQGDCSVKSKLSERDLNLLAALAEYRVLTVSQIATLQQMNIQVVRRKLSILQVAGLLQTDPCGFGQPTGRPERVAAISSEGVNCLKDRGAIPGDAPMESIMAVKDRLRSHQLQVNSFRIQLVQLQRDHPSLSTVFLSPTSVFTPRGQDGKPITSDYVQLAPVGSKPVGFMPDGALSLSDRSRGKTLLFFLEADCGTETIASPTGRMSDVRQKVVLYQAYFGSGRYKRYENLWNCRLRGFRLLFLAPSAPRLAALCRLVQEMPPSDFIWMADQKRMVSHGLGAPIWVRGGRLDRPLESLLGSDPAHPATESSSAASGSLGPPRSDLSSSPCSGSASPHHTGSKPHSGCIERAFDCAENLVLEVPGNPVSAQFRPS